MNTSELGQIPGSKSDPDIEELQVEKLDRNLVKRPYWVLLESSDLEALPLEFFIDKEHARARYDYVRAYDIPDAAMRECAWLI